MPELGEGAGFGGCYLLSRQPPFPRDKMPASTPCVPSRNRTEHAAMIERLQRAVERIEGLPEPVQDKVAELLERFAASYEMRAATARDLPDDAGEPLRRWQHET